MASNFNNDRSVVTSEVQAQEATTESATQTNKVVENSQAAQLENDEKESSSSGLGGGDLFIVGLLGFGFKGRRKTPA